MKPRNIILTGFMGTGKTAAGRLLARRTGRAFLDTDDFIMKQTGQSIPEIFAERGEAAFRELEAEAAQEMAGRSGSVIATGGRLMLDPLNALLLGTESIVICLMADPDEIVARIKGDTARRPLLDTADPAGRIRALLAERATGYAQFPQLDTTGLSVGQVVGEIQDRIGELRQAGWVSGKPISRLEIKSPDGVYPVVLGHDLLSALGKLSGTDGPAVVVTDSNVGPLYAKALGDLDVLGTITLPAGEEYKNLAGVRQIYDGLVAAGLDRRGTVVALGGGVVGDMAGFAAATYLRGVRFVQCPTTVLSMVDASVGGKTGVDLPQGKNLVGAFKQPAAVVADLSTRRTLPTMEVAGGMAEVVKHGLLANGRLWERLRHGPWPPDDLGWQALILEAIRVKQAVVEEDPFEQGRRATLNLGHTFGHALEQVSGYSVPHGQAVAIGLVAAARLSARLGHCSPALGEEIERLLERLGLPTRMPGERAAVDLLRAMEQDKKRAEGRLRFVLLQAAGEAFVSGEVPVAAVRQTLEELGARETENG